MIDHPSYKNDMGCTEYDVEQAIAESARTGAEVALPYSDGAARLLRDACDWESDDAYDYRGTTGEGDDAREWRVYLGPGSPEPEPEPEREPERGPEFNGRIVEMGNGLPDVGDYVGGGGYLYRVLDIGRTETGRSPGAGAWCLARLELVDWEDCPEGDEFPARADIDADEGES